MRQREERGSVRGRTERERAREREKEGDMLQREGGGRHAVERESGEAHWQPTRTAMGHQR